MRCYPGHGPSLVETQLASQIVLDKLGECGAIDHIPLQTAGTGLHVRGYAAEDVGFFPQADLVTYPRKVDQSAFGVPLMQQNP